MPPANVVVELLIGLGVGVLSGLLGIGGGVVLVPAMVYLLSVEQHTAQGVSLAVIVPTAVVGAITHYRHGNVLPRLAVGLGLAAVVGAVVGAWLSAMLDDDVLHRAFGALVVFVGARMILADLWVKR